MSPVTRSQTRIARDAKKEERATEEGLKWAPTPSQFDFTIEAKEGEMVRCHKKILKEKCTFFKDSLKKSSKRFKVCFDVQVVKTFLDYLYNNNKRHNFYVRKPRCRANRVLVCVALPK